MWLSDHAITDGLFCDKLGSQMRTAYLGNNEFLKMSLQNLLDSSLMAVNFNSEASFDFLIQSHARSVAEIEAALEKWGPNISHYVLVSTSTVYPASARHTAWRSCEFDSCTSLFQSLRPSVATARAIERTVQLWSARTGIPHTIVRPALLEDDAVDGDRPTAWYADRILQGGLVVLPSGDLPSYRVVSWDEIARALVLLLGKSEAFGTAVNVAGQAVLSPWGHAALARDFLGAPLRIAYVPRVRWDGAGLQLPLEKLGSAYLIQPSPVLEQLGWEPDPPFDGIARLAAQLAAAERRGISELMYRERSLLAEVEVTRGRPTERSKPELGSNPPQYFNLRSWASRPGSLTIQTPSSVPTYGRPLIETRFLALGATEEKYLKGDYQTSGWVIPGHNAIVEVVRGAVDGLIEGSMHVPLAALMCGDRECSLCYNGDSGLLGVNFDGYASRFRHMTSQHLIPIPPEMDQIALLANPLAALLESLQPLLERDSGPVWISGKTAEAALAIWMVEDAGREVHAVDRLPARHTEFPVSALADLVAAVESGSMQAPTLTVDFTESVDIYWSLSSITVEGGYVLLRGLPVGIRNHRNWGLIPAGATSRQRLEQALARLQSWTRYRPVGARIFGPLKLDDYWEAFLPPDFQIGCVRMSQ